MTEVARLYGDKAEKLWDGMFLKVEITSIEGRTVAILHGDDNDPKTATAMGAMEEKTE